MKIDVPRKILFATDLSAHSDRARERVLLLMKQYGCELLVLHVFHSLNGRSHFKRIPYLPYINRDEAFVEKLRRQISADFTVESARVSVKFERGMPHEAIMRVAMEENCDLIVTGIERNETLVHYPIGKTSERLIGKSEKSLLVVSERAGAMYRKIVVAVVDFSDATRRAIETAVALFPLNDIVLFYPYKALLSSSTDDRESYIDQMRTVAYRDLAAFISNFDFTDDQRARMKMVVEHGNDVQLLSEYVFLSAADLVIIGSRLHRGLSYYLMGGHTKWLVSSLSCDVLIVRDIQL